MPNIVHWLKLYVRVPRREILVYGHYETASWINLWEAPVNYLAAMLLIVFGTPKLR
jgi:hypothetical protein